MNKFNVILLLVLISCNEKDNQITPLILSDIPEISFNEVEFVEGTENFDNDTIRLELLFQDGDLNLGLRQSEIDIEPYQKLLMFLNVDGSGEYVQLKDRNTPEYDTLPPYEFPYYCTNYWVVDYDTTYIRLNPYHNNIQVKFFVEENGIYSEFDWLTFFDPLCGENFNDRFPYIGPGHTSTGIWPVVVSDAVFKITLENQYSGILEYKMTSVGFKLLLKGKSIKLKVRIFDRSLNSSNWIETPPFVF